MHDVIWRNSKWSFPTIVSGNNEEGSYMVTQIIQEAEHACDYESIFEDRKGDVAPGEKYFMSSIGMSFHARCHLIFITIRENYRLVEKLCAWRPKAHIVVFT